MNLPTCLPPPPLPSIHPFSSHNLTSPCYSPHQHSSSSFFFNEFPLATHPLHIPLVIVTLPLILLSTPSTRQRYSPIFLLSHSTHSFLFFPLFHVFPFPLNLSCISPLGIIPSPITLFPSPYQFFLPSLHLHFLRLPLTLAYSHLFPFSRFFLPFPVPQEHSLPSPFPSFPTVQNPLFHPHCLPNPYSTPQPINLIVNPPPFPSLHPLPVPPPSLNCERHLLSLSLSPQRTPLPSPPSFSLVWVRGKRS